MPTGYTSIIDDKENVTFEEFLWKCARAMGACITMRDDSSDAPIPERFEPHDYYVNRLAENKAELEEIESLSDDQCASLSREDYDKEIAQNAEIISKLRLVMSRYDAMIQQVLEWEPPTAEYNDFKEFMLSQLRTGRPYPYNHTEPKLLSGTDWKIKKLEQIQRRIKDYTEENKREIERTESRNKWIQGLRASVPDPSTKITSANATV